jgi:tetratricopeptide (TPR) repeat protein
VALACWSLGNLYSSRGRHDEAIRLLERGLALALEWRIDIMPPVLRPQIGLQLALTGRLEQGLSVVEEGLSGLGSGNAYHGAATTILGRVYAVAGRWNEARSAAELALARTRAGGFRADEGSALWLLGHIAGDGEPLAAEAALAYYQQALALADELGMRPLRAHCLAGLARLYRRTGRLGEAGAHRAAARALFNELGMSPFLPSAKLD